MSRRRPDAQELTVANARLRAELRQARRDLDRTRVERDILREAATDLIHHAPARDRFALIHNLRDRSSVKRLCRVMITDRCNYRGWVRAQARREERENQERQLLERIREIHTAHPAYGAERVTRELKRQRVETGRRRVARIMRENGIAGTTRRKRRNLTKPDPAATAIPDLIQRNFTAPMPGLKLTGDITCLPTDEGWLYLATALDLGSKELIGYSIAPHMRTSMVIDAITMAHDTGLVAGNAIMHTDRGSQYHSRAYRNTLRRLDIRQSTSRTGSCLDGAAAESFFATLKTEIGRDHWPDRATARRDLENWINEYNGRRLHSALGHRAPAEVRAAWQERITIAA